MKQFLCIVTIFMALSCTQNSDSKFIAKSDTVDVLVRTLKDGPFFLKGYYQTTRSLVSEDSNTTKGKWLIDTVWQVRISVDTLRDSLRRPLFDSLHHPYPKWEWRYADKKAVQIVDVPRK